MRAFNSRLFQTRDVELYKRIGAVTAVGVVVLVLWSSVDPAPVVSHPPAPKQIIYSRQCQLNLWNIGLVTGKRVTITVMMMRGNIFVFVIISVIIIVVAVYIWYPESLPG